MSSMEFIGFLFLVALVTFVSILRRRLRGTDQEWTTNHEAEDSENTDAWGDSPQPTANASSQPGSLQSGILSTLVKRKLTELIDSLQPQREGLRGGFPATPPHPEPYSVNHAKPLRPPAPPTVNDDPTQKTATIATPPAGAAESFRHALRDGQSVRRAVIMKELLDRPVAMRGPAIARRLRR